MLIPSALAQSYGFESPDAFVSQLIVVGGIEVHPGLSIEQTANGTGLYFDPKCLNASSCPKSKVPLITVPRETSINMELFKLAIRREVEKWNDFAERFEDLISDYSPPVLPVSQILAEIMNLPGTNESESSLLRSILVFLVIYKKYRCQMLQNLQTRKDTTSELLTTYFSSSYLKKWDGYLEYLLNSSIAVFDTVGESFDLDEFLWEYKDRSVISRNVSEITNFLREDYYSGIKNCIDQLGLKISLPVSVLGQILAIIKSRSLDIPRKMVDEAHFITDISLVPIVDFANHSNNKGLKNAFFDVVPETGDIVLFFDLNTDVHRKSEVLISYNDNDHIQEFVGQYGFVPLSNNVRGQNQNCWDFFLNFENYEDGKLEKVWRWLKIPPSLQVIFDITDDSLRIVAINPEYKSILPLFDPKILDLEYDKTCWRKFMEVQDNEIPDVEEEFYSGGFIDVEDQNAFHFESGHYPRNGQELMTYLGTKDTTTQSRKFDSYLRDYFVPWRERTVTKCLNLPQCPQFLVEYLGLELRILASLKSFLMNSELDSLSELPLFLSFPRQAF